VKYRTKELIESFGAFNWQIYSSVLSFKHIRYPLQQTKRKYSSNFLHDPVAVTTNYTYIASNGTQWQLKILLHHVSERTVQNHAHTDDYAILIAVQTE
jgi:hypothetical protein